MKKEKINKFAGFSLGAKERAAYYSGDPGKQGTWSYRWLRSPFR